MCSYRIMSTVYLLLRCMLFICVLLSFFFFKQKTAYEMRISDWSSDVCSSDLVERIEIGARQVGIATGLVQVGLLRGDGDRARRRGAAAQGALRSAQHFDLADVEHRIEQRVRLDRRVVEIELDGW